MLYSFAYFVMCCNVVSSQLLLFCTKENACESDGLLAVESECLC